MDLIILANAKKEGLSFEELNEFRVRDYVEFSNIYIGSNGNHKEPQSSDIARGPTQKDIDKLLS